MGMEMHSGIFALVHAAALLTVSFFVLLTARKTDSQILKTFGYCIAVLLWISAALVFGKGLSGRHFMMMKKMHMMGGKVCNQATGSQAQQQTNTQAPNK